MGQVVKFSLSCAMRNSPKYIPKYYAGGYAKLSKCGVNVRFTWNQDTMTYQRVPNSWKSVHDHKLELDDRCVLSNDAMRDIKHWWMDSPTIKCTDIIRKVRESSQQVINGQTVYLHLKPLDVLNALKIIRGSGKFKIDELMGDL